MNNNRNFRHVISRRLTRRMIRTRIRPNNTNRFTRIITNPITLARAGGRLTNLTHARKISHITKGRMNPSMTIDYLILTMTPRWHARLVNRKRHRFTLNFNIINESRPITTNRISILPTHRPNFARADTVTRRRRRRCTPNKYDTGLNTRIHRSLFRIFHTWVHQLKLSPNLRGVIRFWTNRKVSRSRARSHNLTRNRNRRTMRQTGGQRNMLFLRQPRRRRLIRNNTIRTNRQRNIRSKLRLTTRNQLNTNFTFNQWATVAKRTLRMPHRRVASHLPTISHQTYAQLNDPSRRGHQRHNLRNFNISVEMITNLAPFIARRSGP